MHVKKNTDNNINENKNVETANGAVIVPVNSINRYIEPLSWASRNPHAPSLLVAENIGGIGSVKVTNVTSSDGSVRFSFSPSTGQASSLDVTANGSVEKWVVTDFTTGSFTIRDKSAGIYLAPVSGTTMTTTCQISISPSLSFYRGSVFSFTLGNWTNQYVLPSTFSAVKISLAYGSTNITVVGNGKMANNSIILDNYGDGFTAICVDETPSAPVFAIVNMTGNPQLVSQVPSVLPGPSPKPTPSSNVIFEPYVDVTATGIVGSYPYQGCNLLGMMQGAGINNIRLSALSWNGSSFSWGQGGLTSMQQAYQQITGANYKATVVFGGSAETPLGLASGDTPTIVATQMANVLAAYPGTNFDFDVETASSWTQAQLTPLLQGIYEFQQVPGQGPSNVGVSLTLAVEPGAVSDQVTSFIAALQAMVTANTAPVIDRFNLMAMDFVGNMGSYPTMTAAIEAAATTVYNELTTQGQPFLTAVFGIATPSLGQIVSITPMIGQNDSQDEMVGCNTIWTSNSANVGSGTYYPYTTSQDALNIYNWCQSQGVGLSFWDLGRDAASANVQYASATGSGIPDQIPYQFSKVFTGSLPTG